jgi:hypothetical protein
MGSAQRRVLSTGTTTDRGDQKKTIMERTAVGDPVIGQRDTLDVDHIQGVTGRMKGLAQEHMNQKSQRSTDRVDIAQEGITLSEIIRRGRGEIVLWKITIAGNGNSKLIFTGVRRQESIGPCHSIDAVNVPLIS